MSLAVDRNFWRGKRVFLTGHTGFKGAWLAAILRDFGADVTGYALPPATDPALFDRLGLAADIRHIAGDIRDGAALAAAMAQSNPDIVLHLAAQALVRKSYNEPLDTFDTNVMGTARVLETARGCKNLRAVVVVTTDKCYRNDDSGKFFTEDDPLGGKDPYSASKAATEIVAQSYADSFFSNGDVAVATARAGNVIGGGDWALDRLIPDAFRAYAAKQPLVIRSPKATRPWQHVLEPLGAYLLLAQKLYEQGRDFSGGWNFGPLPAGIQSVEHVLTLLQKSFPFDLQLESAPQPYEAKTLGLDIGKAQNNLGWQPQLDLAQAVDWTGTWYKSFADGADARIITEKQIAAYFPAVGVAAKVAG